MGDFKIAEHETGLVEGFYANNKSDNGGETFGGVARKFWPKWKGWIIIDKIKADVVTPHMDIHDRNVWKVINKEARKYPELKSLLSTFYKINFWGINQLDQIKDHQIANTVYDFSVNSGEDEAVETLQEVSNAITGDNPKLVVDGDVGRKTLEVVNSLYPKQVHDLYNKAREKFYRKLAERPSQKQFLKSWLSRLHTYNEMKMIQYKLGLVADGIYGEKTKEAIKEFQAKNGLKVDGIPGKNTLEALYKL